jgi:hypothetical protein
MQMTSRRSATPTRRVSPNPRNFKMSHYPKKVPQCLSPRSSILKGKTAAITEKLRPFAGTPFDCGFAKYSGEQAGFWWDLQPVLIAAGWKNVPWRYGESSGGVTQGGRPETGEVAATNVEIHIHEKQRSKLAPAAAALISALNDIGIEAKDMGFNAHNSNITAIHILIGEKR